MDQELRIEHYLLQLDRELKGLTLGQRAEIVTEIKSHIREALERDPARNLDAVLQDLGSAKTVAVRYLAAKGLTPHRLEDERAGNKAGRGWFKWLAIGTVAFFAFLFLSGMAVIWYLSPLIKVDESKGRVTLLGGLIDVNEELGQVHVGSLTFREAMDDKPSVEVKGAMDLATASVRRVRIPFNTAKLELQTGRSSRLAWSCKVAPAAHAEPKVDISAGVATLNLDALNLGRCLISLPAGIMAEIRGVNGHMEVEKPATSMDIELSNGKVNIVADPETTYDFDVKVKNGLKDFFPRSANPEAVKVKVSVTNGVVKKE